MLNFLTNTTSTPVNAAGGMFSTIIMVVMMIAIFYFMLIRPENKRKKEAEELRSSLKNGDKVTTIGGITGVIVDVKDDRFVIETGADRVRIEFRKWALSTNDTAEEAKKEQQKKVMEERAKAVAAKKAERANKKNR